MTEARTCRGAGRELSRPTAARWRGCLETLGLGPVRILLHLQGYDDRRILGVRIGPWCRLVASETVSAR